MRTSVEEEERLPAVQSPLRQLPILGGATAGRGKPRDAEVEDRICDAALACFERFGFSKTSLEDVAKEARCSRATIYRYFSGKEHLALATLHREAGRFFRVLDERLSRVGSFEDLFAEVAVTADEMIGHHRVLGVMLEVEPELLLPHLAFGASVVVRFPTEFLTPHVSELAKRGLISADDPKDVAEWIVRSVLSYLMTPSPSLDFSNRQQVRRLARRYYLPAVMPSGGIDDEPME